MSVLELRMQSGKQFTFIGDHATAARKALMGDKAIMTLMWGPAASPAEVTIIDKYVECVVWYPKGLL